MKIEGNLTFLVSENITRIEIGDANAAIKFIRINITPEQLSALLSRQANVPCEIEVVDLERVGKKHTNKTFAFEIPSNLAWSTKAKELRELAQKKLNEEGEGWVTTDTFSSQGTFFKVDNKQYARCTIRKWD
jgi:hypothetical protein